MAEHAWQPLTPREAAELLAGLRAPWWIAGGWAIDLFIGRETRPHADLDIALLRGTEPSLRQALPVWDIQIAHEGRFLPWDGGPIVAPHHQLWARPDPGGSWGLEFLLEEHAEGRWLYRRHTRVSLPLARLGRTTEDGLPYLCPEVALLYKAGEHGAERTAADFATAAGALPREERRWLRDALALAHPGHAWIERLA